MSNPSVTQTSDSTSSSLLQRARQRDAAAWERLSRLYGPLVYRWCRKTGLQSSDSADVAQEVFQSVASSLDRFRTDRPEDTFRGWLWTITRNRVRDHFRRLARRPHVGGGSTHQEQLQELPEQEPTGDDADPVRSDLARRALELMRTDFEDTTWRAFWLTAVEQQTAADAAAELGLSTAAVYTARSRVLWRLRQELNGTDLLK